MTQSPDVPLASLAVRLARRPWRLVGRAEEAGHVADVLARPTRGHVVLAGAAGVGKTRLAREIATSAAAGGRAVRWNTATRAARAVPLGALLPLVSERPRAITDRLELFRNVVAELEGQRGEVSGRPLVVVDDAHLLDDAGAALLLHVALSDVASTLVTVRSGEPVPDPVIALWKDDVAVRIDVQPLSAAETVELLESTLDGAIEGKTADRLHDASRGNVLFLRELVLSGVRNGRLTLANGLWAWRGRFEMDAPLADVISAALSPEGVPRLLLTCAALVERLPVEVAIAVAGAGAVIDAERRGLLVDHEGEGLGFRHPLFVEAHLSSCGVVELQQARRRLGELLELQPVTTGRDALRRSVFLLDAGLPAHPATLMAGAETALRVAEFELALRLCRAAATTRAGETSGEIDATAAMAEALVALDRPGEADEVLCTRLASSQPLAPAEVVRLAILHSHAVHWGLADLPRADELLARWAERAGDPTARDVVLG